MLFRSDSKEDVVRESAANSKEKDANGSVVKVVTKASCKKTQPAFNMATAIALSTSPISLLDAGDLRIKDRSRKNYLSSGCILRVRLTPCLNMLILNFFVVA